MRGIDLESSELASVAHAVGPGVNMAPSGNLLATLLEANRDGVVVLDPAFCLCLVNRQALHYLNLPGSPEDWLHRGEAEMLAELELYAPEAVVPFRRELQRCRRGDSAQGKGEFRTDYGIIHWVNLPLESMSSTEPDVNAFSRLVILCDVTLQRHLAVQRQDLARLLVDGLQERLTHATQTMRRVAAGQGGDLPRVSQQALLGAIDEADGALGAIQQFVDLERLESGDMPLSMSAFQLLDLVDRVLERAQPAAQRHDVKLEWDVAQGLPLTWGDQGLIERLFQQLVYGVVAATRAGGTVRIEARVSATLHGKVMISIADSRMNTASTVTVPDAGHLSVAGNLSVHETSPPYYRPATLRDLNFAFCQKVVEAHGERIWVLNSRSAGTAVAFTLPSVSESLASVAFSSP